GFRGNGGQRGGVAAADVFGQRQLRYSANFLAGQHLHKTSMGDAQGRMKKKVIDSSGFNALSAKGIGSNCGYAYVTFEAAQSSSVHGIDRICAGCPAGGATFASRG